MIDALAIWLHSMTYGCMMDETCWTMCDGPQEHTESAKDILSVLDRNAGSFGHDELGHWVKVYVEVEHD